MALPLNKRDFDLFLSYEHGVGEFVDRLYAWLTATAGLSVWYDKVEMGGGTALATGLQTAMERCRGVILVASAGALARGWVQNEYNCAMDERANDMAFRVVALRIGGADVGGLMKGLTWIDAAAPALDAGMATALIRALYPGDRLPVPAHARDVFISCSWHEHDRASAVAVCRHLDARGFRLIGDAKDQKGFGDGDRVEHIIESCSALVAIIPSRSGAVGARADDGPYKYFLREIAFAREFGLPCIVIADAAVRREDGDDSDWLRMDTAATRCDAEVASRLDRLADDWREPPKPRYVFWALDLESDLARAGHPLRRIVEVITGMPIVMGNQLQGESLHGTIADTIARAFLVLADITNDNVNSCIEAGMALAYGTRVRLIASGRARNPPFMLRGAGQLAGYADALEHVGVLHRIARQFRRRIINAEL